MPGSSSCRMSPAVDDRLVLLAQRVRAGVDQLLVVRVVLVAEARTATRGYRVEEARLQSLGGQSRLEVRDVLLDRILADVRDRPTAHRADLRRGRQCATGAGVTVRVGEFVPVAALGEAGQREPSGLGPRLR